MTRDKIRKLQDRLIALAEADNLDEGLHLTTSPASPTLGELRLYIFPEWAVQIANAIQVRARRCDECGTAQAATHHFTVQGEGAWLCDRCAADYLLGPEVYL